jgi:acetoin:2,6-dichlorophenolindophenol oxidoreductase subunit beta
MGVSELTYREAISLAIGDAMEADDDVFALGEDIGAAGGALKLTEGLFDRFGPERVLDTPIAEQAIVGTAIGAAIQGLRPVAEIMFSDFAAVCFDGIANELPKLRYMTGGQVSVPVTIRLTNGAAGFAAQHSQPVENWFLNVVGLKIAMPSTPADAYTLLRAAIADPNPVLVFEHRRLITLKGPVQRNGEIAPLGRSETVREGSDVTVVAAQLMRHRAIEAAERLAGDGISADVIDPRTLVPFDHDAVVASLERTNRLVVVQEASRGGSWGDTLISAVCENDFEYLDAPPKLVACDDTPVPYAEALEEAWLPSVDRIEAAIRETVTF